MRALLFAVVLVLGFALVPVPQARAQAPASPAAQQVEPSAGTVSDGGAAALPRYTPPRTLRAYWHLFVAFAVAWVLLFGYTVAIARRWSRLERELDALGSR